VRSVDEGAEHAGTFSMIRLLMGMLRSMLILVTEAYEWEISITPAAFALIPGPNFFVETFAAF
jgi:hypothetical protein